MAGRRWTVVLWVSYVPSGDRGHVLDVLPLALDPLNEYRVVYDSGRDLWRLDQRRHVDGG